MEANPDTSHPVISLLDEQHEVTRLGGTMRLGAQPCRLLPGSRASKAYGKEQIQERHRHRYEFNPVYRETFEKGGMHLSGVHPKRGLVEIVEVPDHPWFLACQFHPEFTSRPRTPNPLFQDFVGAALRYKNEGP